ncbi:hypothetical protein PLICRDRAFT_454320 [Plicaturopsis crispa FD-325 SS-3]|uniref:Uncharacterized protein n=1 Tax=Plicaturopsis crispa FD-325 SS-3 TaxID=944288 RepID=A0A0C9SQ40_PLICR|nr:hypothetical protein PLICRDRAFT_454320 [Plicaturopsis crispa FD-325 SS-3]
MYNHLEGILDKTEAIYDIAIEKALLPDVQFQNVMQRCIAVHVCTPSLVIGAAPSGLLCAPLRLDSAGMFRSATSGIASCAACSSAPSTAVRCRFLATVGR